MTDSAAYNDTVSPFGTIGTGYETGTYSQTPQQDSSESSKSGSTYNSTPAETLSAPPPLPSFSYKVMASRKVNFKSTCLNTVRFGWVFKGSTGVILGRSTHESPIFYFPDVGGTAFYDVTLIAANADGDIEEITHHIEVEDLIPECDFEYVVSGVIVSFTDTSTNIDSNTNTWGFGDNKYSTEQGPHHTYEGNGIYSVRLTRGSFSKTRLIIIDAELILTCDPVSGASGYKWERSADGTSNWTEFADTPAESVGVTEAVHGIDSTVLNFFRVRAYNAVGTSDPSNIANVRCG